MCDVVKRVDVLRHYPADVPQLPQVADREVCCVRLGAVQSPPPEEGARPVPLPRFVRGDEFVEVDGAVAPVLRVGAVGAAVVGEAGGDGDTGAGEEEGFRWCWGFGIVEG